MKTLTRWEQLKLEAEASKYPDIDLIRFVSRGRLIVLQTTPDAFEVMTKEEKLNTIGFIEKSIEALKQMIQKE